MLYISAIYQNIGLNWFEDINQILEFDKYTAYQFFSWKMQSCKFVTLVWIGIDLAFIWISWKIH